MAVSNRLFRQEAIDTLALTHLGEVRLGAPPGIFIGALSLLTLFFVTAWTVGSTEYSRKIPVQGAFDEHHAKQIIAQDFGELVELAVAEGQLVERGEYLGRVSARSFDTAADAAGHEVENQIRQLDRMSTIARSKNARKKQQLSQQSLQVSRLLRLTARDIRLQKSKVGKLEEQFRRTSQLHEKGYLSNLDWLNFQTALISEQQNLNNHRQTGIRLRQQLDDIESESNALVQDLERNIAEIEVQASRLRGQLIDQQRQDNQLLYAPVAGRITRISATPGAAVLPGMPVLHISAARADYSATLQIPSHAAGFVEVGQELQLEVDAFPVERHGRLTATIVHLSDHTIKQEDRNGTFVARLMVDASSLIRPDSGQYLPGMKFQSYIAVEHKSILNWAISPVLKLLDLS